MIRKNPLTIGFCSSFYHASRSTVTEWNNFSAEEIANRSEAKAKNVLRRQTHINDITPRDFVEVCIDMQQQGVGGYDSWGAWPEKWALINPNQSYSWGFTITPLK